MIAKILNREKVMPVLNYVIDKQKSEILSFQNTLSLGHSTLSLLTSNLEHLGALNASKNKFIHISISLPKTDIIDNKTFNNIGIDYMQRMGYGNQPYIIVRHSDTNNPHIHIVTSRVKDNTKLIPSSNERYINKDICRALETKYGLTKNTSIRDASVKNFRYRTSNIHEHFNSKTSTKHYIKERINFILQNYKVRSFKEYSNLLKDYGIKTYISTTKSNHKGISFSLSNDYKSFRSAVIPGNRLHIDFTYPKLEKQFICNEKSSKLIKLKLKKKIEHTLSIFNKVNLEDIPTILKTFNDLDIEPRYNADKRLLGFTVFDNAFVFKSSEITNQLSLKSEVFDSTVTQLNFKSETTLRLLNKIGKTVFKDAFFNQNGDTSYSQFIASFNLRNFILLLSKNKKFVNLWKFVPDKSTDYINTIFQNLFYRLKQDLYSKAYANETFIFNGKLDILKQLSKSEIDLSYLTTSLGLKSVNKYFVDNSNPSLKARHSHDIKARKSSFINLGYSKLNYLTLKQIVLESGKISLNHKAIFLPLIYPELYNNLNATLKERFNILTLEAYYKYAIKNQIPHEKNHLDFIDLLNVKGFFIVKNKDEYVLKSCYSAKAELELDNDILSYLNNAEDLDRLIKSQKIPNTKNFNLENLWLTSLIETKNYGKAAYTLIHKDYTPLMLKDVLQKHLNNGLQTEIDVIKKANLSWVKKEKLNRNIYNIKGLLLNNKYRDKIEDYNGFKDELTNYQKKHI